MTLPESADFSVTLVNPESGAQINTTSIPYGETVGIRVAINASNMELAAIRISDASGSSIPTGQGTDHCDATVEVTSDLNVSVELKRSLNIDLTWQSTAGGNLAIKADGVPVTSPAKIAQGTLLTISLVADNGYIPGTLSINGTAINLAQDNTAEYLVPETVTTVKIEASFIKLHKLVWTTPEPESGTIEVMSNGSILTSGSTVADGSVVTAILTPAQDDIAVSLKANGSVVTPNEKNTFTLTVDCDMELTPEFVKIIPEQEISITISDSAMGTVSYKIGNASEYTTYTAPFKALRGESVTIHIKAFAGHRIKSSPALPYTVNTSSEKIGTYTVGESDETLVVEFETIPSNPLNIGGEIDLNNLPEGISGVTIMHNDTEIDSNTRIPEGEMVQIILKADTEFEITSFHIDNIEGNVAPTGATATVSFTMTAQPNPQLSYTITHRTTSIDFLIENETDNAPMGNVVATYSYFDGKQKVAGSIDHSTTKHTIPTATDIDIIITPNEGYLIDAATIITSESETAYSAAELMELTDDKNSVKIPTVLTTPSAATLSRSATSLHVDVRFKSVQHTYALTISAAGGEAPDKTKPLELDCGTVTYSSNGDVSDLSAITEGTEVAITAEPKAGYIIESIKVNGESQEFEATASVVKISLVITRNTTVEIVFGQRSYKVEVSASPAEGGSPYIGTENTTAQSFKAGSAVTLVAPANDGYKFVKWLLDGHEVKNGDILAEASYGFEMPQADLSFTAVYEKRDCAEHSVTVCMEEEQRGWGTIEVIYPPAEQWLSLYDSALAINNWDKRVEIMAKANADEPGRYVFDRWDIAGAPEESATPVPSLNRLSSTITYSGNDDIALTAIFRKNYKVSVETPVNGTIEVMTSEGVLITPAAPLFVQPGTILTVTVTSNPDYEVTTLLANENETASFNDSGSFVHNLEVNADLIINAIFTQTTGIGNVKIGSDSTEEKWFTIQGQYLGSSRPTVPGLYIRRSRSSSAKVLIR